MAIYGAIAQANGMSFPKDEADKIFDQVYRLKKYSDKESAGERSVVTMEAFTRKLFS